MTKLIVGISTVPDGSMYNRHDMTDAQVIKNRQTYLEKLGIDTAQTTRVKTVYDGESYCRYRTVESGEKSKGMYDDDVEVADALFTTDKHHALLLPIADCIGAVFYDEKTHSLMVSHLGRHSLEQEGGYKTVHYFIEHSGADSKDIKVWFTPAPGKDIYPIWALDNKGMKEVAFEQMQKAGILPENITDNPADSSRDLNYFSYSEFLKGNRDEDADYAIVAMITD